jgi:hypothetical protein
MSSAVFLFALSLLAALATATIAAVFLFRGRAAIAARLARALAAAGAVYVAAILGVALTSKQTIIALGGEKHICEIDCHIAYSVLGVERAQVLGSGAAQARAEGEFYVVTVRTRFDETTVSSQRPLDAPLTPGARTIALLDEDGRSHPVSAAGQAALGLAAPSPNMLTRSLKVGEQFTTKLVFDVPPGVRNPMLLIKDTDFTKWVLLGSETFPLHAKSLFRLDPGPGVNDIAS